MRRYNITDGVFIDLDQIRKAEFDDDGVLITWQDGATDKFDMPKGKEGYGEDWKKNWARKDLWTKLRNDNPPQLLPAAPGFELLHFDTGWHLGLGLKDADPATFDIAAGIIREPVIAWEIFQPEYNFGREFLIVSDHRRNAIGAGTLRQFYVDDQTGPNWTALVLPSGAICAEVHTSYFEMIDRKEIAEPPYFEAVLKPLPFDYVQMRTELWHFENLSKWIEYVRDDWKEKRKWHEAQREWDKKAEAEAAPKAAE